MNGAARLLCIVVLVAVAGCSSVEAPRSQVRDVPIASTASAPTAPADEPLFAKQGVQPTEDGPPIGGPSHAELMQIPDAVPSPRAAEPVRQSAGLRRTRPHLSHPGFESRIRRTRPCVLVRAQVPQASDQHPRALRHVCHDGRSPQPSPPTYAAVSHLENGRTAVVRINDRGPFHPDRIIDLSYAAAVKLVSWAPARVRWRSGPSSSIGAADLLLRAVSHQGRCGITCRWVRTRASSTPRGALAVADRLRPGLASLRPVEREDGILHRVRIGPLPGLEEAESGADRSGR